MKPSEIITPGDVIAAIAAESGVEPIVVEVEGGWELWRGGRMVEVGLDVLLPSLDRYRSHWKSISVDGCRYGLDGAARSVRLALVGGVEEAGTKYEERVEPNDPVDTVPVDIDDLRALLAHAPAEMRDRYAHVLDDRELPEDA